MPKADPLSPAKIVALSIRQPYADHVVFGDKRIENRTWQTSYRGPLFIHASSSFNPEDEDYLPSLRRGVRERSAFIGLVTLADIFRRYEDIPEQALHPDFVEEPEPGDPALFYWHLINPVPFKKPIACKGKLNLWSPPPDVAAQLARYI
jgi:hypothetical protein